MVRHMVKHFSAPGRLAAGGRPVTRDEAREFLEELQRVCIRELRMTGSFSIPKVAKLVFERRAPRRGRNPVTGEPMVIPAQRVVRARVSSLIRAAVEGPPKVADAGLRRHPSARSGGGDPSAS